ncbi:MAG: adenine phosphoribosyltransferase [Thermoleophilia bacterium]|nr:adenine phosphoribosyltransferase [Thermoleophilia bacterium]
MELEKYIRHIPGFPREGILFHDIMPLLQEPEALRYAVDKMAEFARERRVDLVLGAEARGFILGAALAYALGVGFAAARKPGKLPWTVSRCEYELEYGTDALEIHTDAIRPGQRVLIHDDLLATGGTARAKIELVERAGGVVAGLAFLIELTELGGRERLAGYDVFSLIQYEV